MCDVCNRIMENVPTKVLTAFEGLTEDAVALGAKAAEKLIEAGFLAMDETSFTDEDRATGKDKRIAALYGLSAIAGFATNAAYHEQHLVQDTDSIFSTTADLGWAYGHIATTSVKN